LSHSKEKTSHQNYNVNQTSDVNVHHSNLHNENKKHGKEEHHHKHQQESRYNSENVDSDQRETRGVGTQEEQPMGRGSNRGQASSWKDLAKGIQTTISPSRPSQLHVVAGMQSKKPGGQTHFKSFMPTRDPKLIKQHITNAMATHRVIWVSYDGGKQPLVPRGVSPTKWDDYPGAEVAFLGVPYHTKTGNESKFFLRHVKEVRDRFWLRPEDPQPNRNKNKTNQGQRERGNEKNGQGGTRNEKRSHNNTNDENAGEADPNIEHPRSKQKQRSRENKKEGNVHTSESTQSTQ